MQSIKQFPILNIYSKKLPITWFRSLSSHCNTTTQIKPNLSKVQHTSESLPIKNFALHQANNSTRQSKSLAVMFAWLYSKDHHIDKYRQLYLEKGMDVLTVHLSLLDFLCPTKGCQKIATNATNWLATKDQTYESYIFHTFSIGTYQMGEVLCSLNNQPEKQTAIRAKLKGIILDSPTDISNCASAMAYASTNKAPLQLLICLMMHTYIRLSYNAFTRHIIAGCKAVDQNSMQIPTLVYISKDDQIINYQHTLDNVEMWKSQGIQVRLKIWSKSVHVSHFLKYPSEYQKLLNKFLADLL